MDDSESEVGKFSIATVSDLTQIPVTTLRFWEKSFGLVRPVRTEGGHRLYSDLDLERLHWIKAKIDGGIQARAAHRLLELELENGPRGAAAAPARGVTLILFGTRDPMTVGVHELFLGQRGYAMRIVHDGLRLVREAQATHPEVVIVDFVLPGAGGLEVCEVLKADPKTADIPVLMFSVFDIRERALAAGADAFLQKPAEGAELVAAVEGLLAARRPDAL